MSVDAVGVHTRRTARVLAEHYPLILLALAYAGIALLARPLLGSHDHQLGKTVLIQTALATGIIVAVVVVILKAASLVGRLTGSPTDWSEVLSPYRIGSASLVLALNGLVMSAFLDFKARIPDIQPFAWDTTLMELDRALHFGHPWTWLSWIPEAGTLALDTVYWIWFTVNLVFVAFMAWQKPSPHRQRFFLAFFGLWIVLGSGLGTALSSAGPCYYERIVGADGNPYAPQMAYLQGISPKLTALQLQELLWTGYTAGAWTEGISAMPSLHVAVPILFALVVWPRSRALAGAMAAFAFLIFIGSIHLGWHYAVDGYVSLVMTMAVWWVSGRIAAGSTTTTPEPRLEPQ